VTGREGPSGPRRRSVRGHAAGAFVVEEWVSTTHHPDTVTTVPQREARCLRHHVWMAACDDCRDAHAVPRQRTAADR
jgi:hypothetical protein